MNSYVSNDFFGAIQIDPLTGAAFSAGCQHSKHMPKVPADTVLCDMSVEEIRENHPRYRGQCVDCGQLVILYGSYMHYIAGDW